MTHEDLDLLATEAEVAQFQKDGFVVFREVLPAGFVEQLRERFPLLFAGEFETGTYPDEWYWREGISLPDVTRHMSNAWKADLTVAQLVLSEALARIAAMLAGWPGARLGQDTIWWKPAMTKPIVYHQDTSYMDFLLPPQSVTCWVALDDTVRDAGTLEYAPGSHRWQRTRIPSEFHAVDNYRAPMLAAARSAGIGPPEPFFVEVPAGSCAFHNGDLWHGSGPNQTKTRMRRSIGVHFLPEQITFAPGGGGYIYRRYQLSGRSGLDTSFFPVLWSSRQGGRTEWMEKYLRTGQKQ